MQTGWVFGVTVLAIVAIWLVSVIGAAISEEKTLMKHVFIGSVAPANLTRILNAYSLAEAIQWQGDKKVVAQRIESEEMVLALPVNHGRAWIPPSWSHMKHCRPLASEVSGEAPMAFTRVSAPVEVEGLHGLAAWLGDLSSEDVYVLSEDDFDSGTDNRVITWDPDESVSVGRPDRHRRPW